MSRARLCTGADRQLEGVWDPGTSTIICDGCGLAQTQQIRTYGIADGVALNNLTRKEHFTALAVTLVVLAALISIYAIFQWGGKSDRVWTFVRSSGGRWMLSAIQQTR